MELYGQIAGGLAIVLLAAVLEWLHAFWQLDA
jgi:hypothetical protein